MKRLATAGECSGARYSVLAICLVACYCSVASAQMLAPSPNSGAQEAPPSTLNIPVRVVPVPHGKVLERMDLPPAASADEGISQNIPDVKQQGRYRIAATRNGAKVLERIDAAPPPEENKSTPPGLVVRTNASGAGVLVLPDETPAPKRQEPQRRIVDIRAESTLTATPREPEPDVLYRVVRP